MNIIDIALGDIVTGHSYRTEMVNIAALATSITEIGLLQPIGITPDRRLIFGSRRVAAFRLLKYETIPARVIEMERIVLGTYAENEMREDFTVSERVAIMEEVQRQYEGRVGTNQYSKEGVAELPHPLIPTGVKTREVAAQRSGLSSGRTAHNAKYVVNNGAPAVVEALDKNEISIDAAYIIVSQVEDKVEQTQIVSQPRAKRKAIVADLKSKPREKKEGAKKSNGTAASFKRPAVDPLPTYKGSLTLEEQGYPPREQWHERDPDQPHLTKLQSHIFKHGRVHVMPINERQAQDARIAARKLSSQVRELKKQPITAFQVNDLMDLVLWNAALNGMEDDDAKRVVQRLSVLLMDIMPVFQETHAYLTLLDELIEQRKQAMPKLVEETASEIMRPAWVGAGS